MATPRRPAAIAPVLPGPGARRRGRPRTAEPLVVEVEIPVKVDPVARQRFLEALAGAILEDAEKELDNFGEHDIMKAGG
jgi:hypothetical protein